MTMSSIDSLLNHEPAPSQRRQSRSSGTHDNYVAQTTTYEAADALTTLATLGSGQQYAPARELPSPTAFAHAPPRTSSFGSHVAPVEPSPPIEQPQTRSPTLEQYHHGSKSPEQQRRQSLLNMSSPAPILAPIHSLTSPAERIHHDPHLMSPSYGKDVSQMVPPPSRSSDDGASGRDNTQNREPAFARDQVTTSQIRDPESLDNTPHPVAIDETLLRANDPQLASPPPVIKNEPSGTPREATPSTTIAQSSEPQPSLTTEGVDAETRKAIETLKQNDLGLRVKRNASVSESIPSPTDVKPALASSKKRSAPSVASKKKGTAAVKKPAAKKRKVDTDADPAPRSVTPTSRPAKQRPEKAAKRGSQAGTPVADSSPAPDNSSQAHPSDDEGDSSDDTTLYCICRKPDNHKWMIGCDGGCDDWFHGSCVNMLQSEEDLLDKFICPNCEEGGRGQTTWKPMCRRNGCRKPARLTRGKESKYCSNECGLLFCQDQLQRTAGAGTKKAPSKRTKKKAGKDGEEPGRLSDEDEEPTPLGGVLRAKDLKALVLACNNIEDFKRLGTGVPSPPQTASPSKATFNGANTTSGTIDSLPFTISERARLDALNTEKLDLQAKLEVLKDREKFVSMMREQAVKFAEKEKLKVKEFCGYDSRLSWSDSEFVHWRNGNVGRAVFKFNTLTPTAEQIASVDAGGDVHTNGVNGEENEKDILCTKKRCLKHGQWQKLNLQDARFEEVEAVEAIKECEKQEREVRERARRRAQKDAMEAELVGGTRKDEKNREGWVEVVDA